MSKWKRFLLLGSLSVVLLAGLMFTAHTKMNTAHATSCNTVAEGWTLNSTDGLYYPTWRNNCTVSQGNTSNFVYAIQVMINNAPNIIDPSFPFNHCGTGTADGIFDQETVSGVKCFQRALGLSVDGIVGPQTWTFLAGQISTITITSGWNYFSYTTGGVNFRMYGASPNKWYVQPVGGCWRQVNLNTTACE